MYYRALVVSCVAALAACSTSPDPDPAEDDAAASLAPGEHRRAVVEDAVATFFKSSDAAVVAASDADSQLAAARFAVAQGLPMLDDGPELAARLDSLGATAVTTFGAVGQLPAGIAATPGEVVASDVTDVFPRMQAIAAAEPSALHGAAGVEADRHTTALVTAESGLAAIATARAAGATVIPLAAGDPRASTESLAALKTDDVVAIGPAFGTQERFDDAAQLAANGELPGGGGLVFPGRRMVALYGHPSGPALGALGEQGPAESVARVQELAAQYQQLTQYPVIPAFEIIATVASGGPGDDGDYSNVSDPAELVPYVDAITQAGGYAVLDLQPGRANLLDQAKLYADLLKRPNVGLALDPEWKLGPADVPMTDVGHVEAQEINAVADWLAQLTRDNRLPQKALIIHQFQLQMVRDRASVRTDHPELAMVIHADGHGPTGDKLDTWNVMQQDLQPGFFMAWKNFIDEDQPLLDPAQTFSVEPRPWFISYQ